MIGKTRDLEDFELRKIIGTRHMGAIPFEKSSKMQFFRCTATRVGDEYTQSGKERLVIL